jgi:hypothetical protein
MFDVFYFGPKPGLFAFEQPASSLEDAAKKSRTTGLFMASMIAQDLILTMLRPCGKQITFMYGLVSGMNTVVYILLIKIP